MNDGTFTIGTLKMQTVTENEVSDVQSVLDHAPYYHSNIVQYPASGLAQRCLTAEVPKVEGSRVFKRYFLIEDSSFGPGPLAALDLFVGFPNYKTASVAMLVIREDYQRKGLGTKLLTEGIPGFLNEYHPAVQFLSISLTENNVPALRCLLKCEYERTNRWEKLDIRNRPVIALTFRKNIKS
ncbi:MAG: GNAT family N-acetyltransferase [Proteobacteria bacterium]|nr:GNAT family N-acetyltransferase [Pseudomonadota bacterium]